MKKSFLALTLVLFSFVKIFAFDFGGLLINDSIIKSNSEQDLKLDQKDTAEFWIRTPFSNDGNSYFIAEFLYQFENDFNQDLQIHTIDSDLFKAVWLLHPTENDFLRFSLGRFYTSDLTSCVYAQNADGLNIEYKTRLFEITGYGAYTGLLNSHTTSIISANAVSPFADFFTNDNDKVYCLQEKYLVTSLIFSLPRLFLNQTLNFEYLGTFRLENEEFNRIYAEAQITGPLVKNIYYDASTVFAFVRCDGEDMDFANLSKLSATYFDKRGLYSIGLNGLYASKKNDTTGDFVGFTSLTAYNSQLEPEYTGILKAGLSATLRPVSNLVFLANWNTIFDYDYKGFEYSITAKWQATSDLKLSAGLLQYFDHKNADNLNNTKINFNAVFAF